jgi:Copine
MSHINLAARTFILVNGDVERVKEVIEALVAAATLTPLSIRFVGIGEASFEKMRFTNDVRHHRKARDIAECVLFNKHSQHSQLCISEACHEIPQQLTDYHESKRIKLMPQIVMTDKDLDILAPLDTIDIESFNCEMTYQ